MKKLTLTIIIFYSMVCFAQNFRLGFSNESYQISVNGVYDKKHTKFYPLYSTYLLLEFKLSDFLTLENRSGFLLEGYGYDGLELGFYTKISPINSLPYIPVGFILHFNSSADRNFSSNNSDVIKLISLGLGYNFSRTGFVEILFQKPFNNIFGSYIDDVNYSPSIQIVNKPMKVNYLVKLVVGFAWEL